MMRVVCQDGTIFECEWFRAIDSGVLLFQESPEETEADADAEPAELVQEAAGFVPLQQVRYVLSERLQPTMTGAGQPTQQRIGGGPGGTTGQPAPGPTSAPPQGGAPMGTGGRPQGGHSPQQGAGQRPGERGGGGGRQ